MRGAIPPAALVREEERLQAEIAALKTVQDVGKKQREMEDHQRKLFEDLNKLKERIGQEEQAQAGWNPFHPLQRNIDTLAKIHPFNKITKKKIS